MGISVPAQNEIVISFLQRYLSKSYAVLLDCSSLKLSPRGLNLTFSFTTDRPINELTGNLAPPYSVIALLVIRNLCSNELQSCFYM